jgi:hypothetical protein
LPLLPPLLPPPPPATLENSTSPPPRKNSFRSNVFQRWCQDSRAGVLPVDHSVSVSSQFFILAFPINSIFESKMTSWKKCVC